MDCSAARDALSARIDDEVDRSLDGDLEVHLAGCPSCRMWAARAHHLRRITVMRRSDAPMDLTDRVLDRLSVPDVGPGEWIRYALGVVAGALMVLNGPLLLGLAAPEHGHDERHLGAFGVALGAGLLWAAIRPERAIGLVPMAGALVVAMVVGALVDLRAGSASAMGEGIHALELLGVGLLWLLSGGRHRLRIIRDRWRPTGPLRAV